ncbi:uncharacterized protein [Battus philenor]|uniref:uncharacterized protein n=1 Tax=Battus philenor TaxID=42288 RepID=UPI0035CFF3D5
MLQHCALVTLFIVKLVYTDSKNETVSNVDKKEHHVYWPNAVVPFYIDPDHFDHEQSLSIMTSLSLFAFKTCLKFTPVLVRPSGSQHVMLFQNPNGIRKCIFNTEGHSTEEPHRIILGYNCLKSPQIEMTVMRALGFPFEHNRASRDIYIDVQFENIDPDAMELFAKDSKLPIELRPLHYDVNSVMHFGDREFSKNGHRTIIFKDHKVRQDRKGLSDLDLRKIEIVYGSECQKRDRQEKIDLCQNYPGVARRKRQVDLSLNGPSLRVNRDITAPPDDYVLRDVLHNLTQLAIQEDVKEVLDKVQKLSILTLNNVRKKKRCNETVSYTTSDSTDVLGILDLVTNYAKSIERHAEENPIDFCEESKSIDKYKTKCDINTTPLRNAKPTRIGEVRYSTQHRPTHRYSTIKIHGDESIYDTKIYRTSNNTDIIDAAVRKKRSIDNDMRLDDPVKQQNDTAMEEKSEELTETLLETTAMDENTKTSTPKMNVDVSKDSHGRRRFQDFSVYKRKPNDEAQMDEESDLSMEVKQEERTKVTKKKNAITTKKTLSNVRSDKHKPVRPGKSFKPTTVKLSKGNKEFYAERRWPNNVVRYVIKNLPQYDLDDVRRRLGEVNNILKSKTCVRIKEITEAEAKANKDYLVLDDSPNYVTGRVGGKQNFGVVELFKGGQHRQHAAMVVMSMLGFYFEPSRHDRDKYIRVHNRHIRPDKLHYFEKLRPEATLPLPYDYSSATQPAWQYWRQLGRSGISTVATYKDQDPDGTIMKSMGHNPNLLSDSDIVKINSVYGIECFK